MGRKPPQGAVTFPVPQSLHLHYALAGLEGEFDRVGEASLERSIGSRRNHETVYNDVNGVRLFLVERGKLVDGIYRAVDLDARKAVALHCRKRFFVPALLALHERGVDDNFCATCPFPVPTPH